MREEAEARREFERHIETLVTTLVVKTQSIESKLKNIEFKKSIDHSDSLSADSLRGDLVKEREEHENKLLSTRNTSEAGSSRGTSNESESMVRLEAVMHALYASVQDLASKRLECRDSPQCYTQGKQEEHLRDLVDKIKEGEGRQEQRDILLKEISARAQRSEHQVNEVGGRMAALSDAVRKIMYPDVQQVAGQQQLTELNSKIDGLQEAMRQMSDARQRVRSEHEHTVRGRVGGAGQTSPAGSSNVPLSAQLGFPQPAQGQPQPFVPHVPDLQEHDLHSARPRSPLAPLAGQYPSRARDLRREMNIASEGQIAAALTQ